MIGQYAQGTIRFCANACRVPFARSPENTVKCLELRHCGRPLSLRMTSEGLLCMAAGAEIPGIVKDDN